MNRLAISMVVLLLMIASLGRWFLSETDRSAAAQSTSESGSASLPLTDPTTLPSTQPAAQTFKITRGTPGFWRVAQDTQGAWWFLSPSGKKEFLNTVTTVQPFQLGRDADGPQFVSSDWTGNKNAGDGDLEKWAQATWSRASGIGFKGLGAWCHPVFHKLSVPMTRDLNLWTWQPSTSRRLYTPEWIVNATKAAETQILPLKDNPNLVGYYIDNEIDWGDGFSGPSVYFDSLPPIDPNRMKVVEVIQRIWPTLDGFNKDWKDDLKDWKDLDNWSRIPHERSQGYTRLSNEWLGQLASDYFQTTCSIIRKLDSNHLILGVRFKGWAPQPVVKASRNMTDVQSLNSYVGDARLDLEMFRMMYEESGEQPIIISEYAFHALDGRSGNRNTVGFGAQVLDQQARADGYKLFTSHLARVPYVIGAEWFQWMDEPPSGRTYDGEDVNFGVVDIDDRPYELLTAAIKDISPKLNDLHAASPKDEGQDIWRESFATKPVFRVPYLTKPIKLNGELSDWPPQTKLQGIRHSQTVGLERSKLPLPNCYMGWTDEGLYLGMEVFDNDIQGTPANGWWWTRDCVEFWISTRPVASDQNTYDVYSHQFFFVPIDFPTSDGQCGTIGQWHRPGDALKDNLIPHSDVKKAVRVLPDRYVFEAFLPSKAMHGFDPKTQPALAFNLQVRNFQHATEYFWSAPKEVMTQLRARTWGSLYLEPVCAPGGQVTLMPKK